VATMRDGHPLERQFGMELYSTDFDGVGGRLKRRMDDFVVEEITPDGHVLTVQPWSRDSSEQETLRPIEGDRSRFVTFVLQKIALSTMDVAAILAAELKISRQAVSYAGLKDKRAITVQLMSVPARAAERLRRIRLARIDIRDIRYTRHAVQIGDLWGNRFTIRLREMAVDCETAARLMGEVTRRPLLNYFGVQRFGVTRPYTHLVGKALVRNDFESAVRLMLTTTSEFESPELTEARRRLAENLEPDEKILSMFPPDLRYEQTVMKQLMKRPGDYKRAFSQVPPKVQTIFVHAYQSYLFNRLISARMRRGASIVFPEPGDFVIQLDRTHTGRDSWLYVTERNLEERIRMVESGEYGLAAPVPGYATKMPPSWQTDLLHAILRDEGIELQEFRKPDRPALDSAGGLHLVSMSPLDLSTECVEGDLVVRFSLRKGSYATVVMRELMKNHPINRI